MDLSYADKALLLPFLIPGLIAAAIFHELAHAVVARLLGDPTAERAGRITLHPIKHLDPVGSAMFLFTFMFTAVTFGWARPVPVEPGNFRHPQRDMALVAVAGPLANLVVALVLKVIEVHVVSPAEDSYVGQLFFYAISINIVLSVFNLFPLPPLDGSRIIGAFMPPKMYRDWVKLDQYAILFLLFLFFIASGPFFILMGSAVNHVDSVLRTIVGG